MYKVFGEAYQRLKREEQLILATAYLEEKVSNAGLQSVLGLHSTEVGQLLFGLVDKKMLANERRGRWTTDRINEEYMQELEPLELIDISTPKQELNSTIN